MGSNNTLTKNLQKSATGKPVSQAQLRAATRAALKGNVDLNAGAKLLGV